VKEKNNNSLLVRAERAKAVGPTTNGCAHRTTGKLGDGIHGETSIEHCDMLPEESAAKNARKGDEIACSLSNSIQAA
jgi:hypothetical protein